jgi:hypothetical protein
MFNDDKQEQHSMYLNSNGRKVVGWHKTVGKQAIHLRKGTNIDDVLKGC